MDNRQNRLVGGLEMKKTWCEIHGCSECGVWSSDRICDCDNVQLTLEAWK